MSHHHDTETHEEHLNNGSEAGPQTLLESNGKGPSPREKTILKCLRANRHASIPRVAELCGGTVDSATGQVKAMRRKEWIDNGWRIDPKVLGCPERYRVDITVIPSKLRAREGGRPEDVDPHTKKRIPVQTQQGLARYIVVILAKDPKFADSIFVEDVRVLLGGPADLSASVWAQDNESMIRFVTYGLRMAEGIQGTVTAVELWTYPAKKL